MPKKRGKLFSKEDILHRTAPVGERVCDMRDQSDAQASRDLDAFRRWCELRRAVATKLVDELSERGQRVLGVDFDPDLVHRLRETGHAVVYGDAEDPEFASTLPLSHPRWVVSSVPQRAVNSALLQALSRHGFSGRIATTAHNDRDAEHLKDAGSDLILLPFLDAAKEAADELCGPRQAEPQAEALGAILTKEESPS